MSIVDSSIDFANNARDLLVSNLTSNSPLQSNINITQMYELFREDKRSITFSDIGEIDDLDYHGHSEPDRTHAEIQFTVVAKRRSTTLTYTDATMTFNSNVVATGLNKLREKLDKEPIILVSNLLNESETQKQICFDGLPLISENHEYGESGVQSNLLTGTGITLDNLRDDLETAVIAMSNFKDDRGNIQIIGDLYGSNLFVVCKQKLVKTFNKLRDSTLIDGGDSNEFQGDFQIVVSNLLEEEDSWYVVNIEGSKPIVVLQASNPNIESERSVRKGETLYVADWDVGISPYNWKKIVKIKNVALQGNGAKTKTEKEKQIKEKTTQIKEKDEEIKNMEAQIKIEEDETVKIGMEEELKHKQEEVKGMKKEKEKLIVELKKIK